MPEDNMDHSSAVRLKSVTFHSQREMIPENNIDHSSAVRLRDYFHSLREMTSENIYGPLKRRSV
jgi:hypothetical protein